jgi:hypothetical protein
VTAVREAIVLPLIFLTVTLVGGVQPGTPAAFVPPSVFSLVLAIVLIGALVGSGALAPERLLDGSRAVLANANGAVVLATLVVAAAEVFTMLTPETGLPRFFVDVFLLVLLLNTMVARPERVRLLRSLAVILCAALVVKFILLASMSDPSGSRVTRVLEALFDAATFGSIAQQPQHPAAGYLALLASAGLLIGITALPVPAWALTDTGRRLREGSAGGGPRLSS